MDPKTWTATERRVIGVMTGTSLDGIDIAVCRINTAGTSCTLEAFETVAYSAPVLENIKELLHSSTTPSTDTPTLNASAIAATQAPLTAASLSIRSSAVRPPSSVLRPPLSVLTDLHTALALEYADAIAAVCERHGIDRSTIDAIGMHGQTLWHAPEPHDIGMHRRGSTLQLGSVSTLATTLGITTVGDFRAADVAVGGQGAPLVPRFDVAMLRDATRARVALNVGGMANMTVLPPGSGTQDVIAFDTGPGNVLIDAAARRTFGMTFDRGGALARAGRVNARLLEALQLIPFFAQAPPKSTGREIFNEHLVELMMREFVHPSSPGEDVVATMTELTAWSIADHVERFAPTAQDIIVSGGGTHNAVLMERLAALMPTRAVLASDAIGLSGDAKEAMCFAWLAWRTLAGEPGNMPAVTGADREVVLGVVARPA